MNFLKKNLVLTELVHKHLKDLSLAESMETEEILGGLNSGRMVLLGNPNHPGLEPLLVGQPARVKVNANIGTSPLSSSLPEELQKLKIALDAGADTMMDLSIAGNLNEIRKNEGC